MVLSAGRREFRIGPKGRIIADEPEMLKIFATMGLGIVLLPDFLAGTTANESKLIQVLPDWHWDDARFRLVYPAQRFYRAQNSIFPGSSGQLQAWTIMPPSETTSDAVCSASRDTLERH